MLTVDRLSVSYQQTASPDRLPVLDALSFSMGSGSFCSIVGPSGCGKSTLLHCLAGLLPIDRGTILLNGDPPSVLRMRHKLGVVFQRPVFFDWLTILANVALPAEIAGCSLPNEKARSYLHGFGIGGFAKAFPHELSGGMLARAALARSLVHHPEFLFFDEAFDHLDESLRIKIGIELQRYWLDKRPTVMAVTHNLVEALWMADTVVVLSQRPARLIDIVEVDFSRPRDLSVMTHPSFLALLGKVRARLSEVNDR